MITPRATRLVRAAGVQAFREAAVALACDGSPLDARDRVIVVPTRAAAAQLRRTIEDTGAGARLMPDVITPAEIPAHFAGRLSSERAVLTPAEREVLLGVACRHVQEGGTEPPYQVRASLVAEILSWYDDLRRRQQDVDSFERLALDALEPGAVDDRGAERLVRQTRFLVAAFREFERLSAHAGADEHALRSAVIRTPAERPIRHVVLTVTDRSIDPRGLLPADWDLLARVPLLARLDVLVTETRLAGALHERLHRLLPGIEEVQFDIAATAQRRPTLRVPSREASVYEARDREDEVETFARHVRHLLRNGEASSLDRIALVVNQPLPYVYVARAVLQSAGIPCQLFDALPLAAEPYAAALDLVLSSVGSGFARAPALALLRSPHFCFARAEGARLQPDDLAALDDLLSSGGYGGDMPTLDRTIEALQAAPSTKPGALAAARVLRRVIGELGRLLSPASAGAHLETLLAFITSHEIVPSAADPWHERRLRARAAILGTLVALRDGYARFDNAPVAFDEVAALVRRWIDGQTFAPRSGEHGVHVLDAASAPFGCFEHVHLAGLVDGEWPDRQRRSIFYSAGILRDLGWPADALRLEGTRAAFADLLMAPSHSVSASTFLLEDDSLVSASALVEDVERVTLARLEQPIPSAHVFDHEALGLGDSTALPMAEPARAWAAFHMQMTGAARAGGRSHSGDASVTYPVSALERYQDCPFRFFAAHVLRLRESPEEEDPLSPREHGRFVHEVFERFFETWDARTNRAPIEVSRVDEARELFREVAEPLLARLNDADAALARARLFGSAISVGIVDVALAIEAAVPGEVRERWLEYRFEGEFGPGASGRRLRLSGVVDRVDLLAGHRLRVIDYKTGAAPNPRRALQVPVYALCLQEMLTRRDGVAWRIEQGAYVAFAGKRPFLPVVQGGGAPAGEALESACARLFEAVDGIARSEFPPRPHDPLMCRGCPYPSVCRKEYVDG